VHDTHYMCYTRYTAHPEHYEGMNLLRDRRFGTPVVALQVGPAILAPGRPLAPGALEYCWIDLSRQIHPAVATTKDHRVALFCAVGRLSQMHWRRWIVELEMQ